MQDRQDPAALSYDSESKEKAFLEPIVPGKVGLHERELSAVCGQSQRWTAPHKAEIVPSPLLRFTTRL